MFFYCILIVTLIPLGESIKSDTIFFNFKQIKDIAFESITNETNNWSGNQECLNELYAIKNGLDNFNEWAIEVVDSWGNFPSGIMRGNFFDFGAFSQCFHITRNGKAYDSQYCIGQLKFRGQIETNTVKPKIDVGPGVSIGLCFPKVCSVDYLESLIDEAVRAKSSKMTFVIPKNTCQLEENASNLKAIDISAIGLFGAVLLMIVLSTTYDIFHTVHDRDKYQPFLAFSVYTNGKKLFSCKKSNSSDQIDCLHGIRSIATMWIALAHMFSFFVWLPIRNRSTMNEFLASYRSMIWVSALIVVDTWLVLSGILASMSMLGILKRNEKLNISSLYLLRYLRMTPLMGVYVLISVSLYRFLGNGPVWPVTVDFFSENCQRFWWSAILHIQNYVNPGQICLPNTWYVSVDMQLFILSPFIVHLIHRLKAKSLIILIALILGCVGLTLALHWYYELTLLLANRKIEIAYFPTHVRYSSWLIGIIAGYIFVECPKDSIRVPKALNLSAWILSIAAMLLVVFGNHPFYQNSHGYLKPIHYGLYDALSRVVWSISLCYIIFACHYNFGGPINWFLSHRWWLPLSRLSYSLCLVHYPIFQITMFSMKSAPDFDELSTNYHFISTYVICIIVAIVATLAFESPIISIANIIFSNSKDSGSNITQYKKDLKKKE